MVKPASGRDPIANPRADLTPELAALQPPAPELAQVLAAVHGSMEAMDAFARVSAGVRSPTEFVSGDNVACISAVGQR